MHFKFGTNLHKVVYGCVADIDLHYRDCDHHGLSGAEVFCDSDHSIKFI